MQMSQSVTYYAAAKLVYLNYGGHINFTNLAIKVADWKQKLSLSKGYDVLVDLRSLLSVDRPADGADEFVKLQEKLHHQHEPARRMAILALSPEAFVFARIYEQMSQGHTPTEIEIFRTDPDALAFLDVAAAGVDAYLASLGAGLTLR
ncbi:hypothetical protein ACXYMP_06330 [Aliiroseovarius sp. CAU 1755]